jgi:hypothetical protein
VVDTVKWNMLAVRREAEVALAATGLDVALVRAGMLVDAGARPLRLWRGDAPLRLAGKVSRADVAALLVDLLDHPGVADVSVEWSASGAAEGRLGSLIDAAA